MQGRPTRRPKICVFGYHLTGSTGTLFLLGIMVGAVALLELSVPLARERCTADTHARRTAARFQRDMAFANRVRDTRLEHQQRADSAAVAPAPPR